MSPAEVFWAPLTTLVIVLGWSGLVANLMPGPFEPERWRTQAAHVLCGVLLFSALFGVLAEVRADTPVALAILGWGTAAGLLAQFAAVRKHPEWLKPLVCIATGIVVARVAVSAVPVNLQAVDPYNYAFGVSAVFSDGWLTANAPNFPHFDEANYIAHTMWVGRAPDIALVWPLVAVGQGVTIDVIFAAALFFLIAAWLVLFDTIRGQASSAQAVVIATAGIGALNVVSILVGGQINQAFAIFAVVTLLWLARYSPTEPIFLVGTGLVSFAIGAGYTEMLAAFPVYVGGAVLLRGPTLTRLVRSGVVALGGVLLVLALTRLSALTYLLQQGGALATWQPLPLTPGGPLEAWELIAIGPWMPWWSVALVAPLVFASLRRKPPLLRGKPSRLVSVLMLVGLALVLGFCTWSIFRSPNTNYATFKLNGWLGPGMMLVSWVLAASITGRIRLVVCTIVLSLAVVRATTLPGGVAVDLLTVETVRMPEMGWRFRTGSAGDPACEIQPGTSDYLAVLRAIAESGAPMLGCRLLAPD